MSLNIDGPSEYKISVKEAVTFQIVYDENDIEEPNKKLLFKPDMSYQIFGDNESIFGYKNLSIKLYYTHNSSQCCLKIKYSDKIKDLEADDLDNILSEWLPQNFSTDENLFKKNIRNENSDQMFGKEIHKFEKTTEVAALNGAETTCEYIITECDASDESFQTFHQRFETFIIWFIEAANYIDLSDPRWVIFYVYEKFVHPQSKKTFITPIGFAANYKFFHYPDSSRLRVSQFFILPTHQSKGIGSEFYKAIYNRIIEIPDIVELTVEEPVKKFQAMRDLCDSLLVYKDLQSKNMDVNVHLKSQKSLYSYMSQKKICKKQAQRISHIIQLFGALTQGSEAVVAFTESLKQWIRSGFERDIGISKSGKIPSKTNARLLIASQLNLEIQDLDVDTKLVNYLSEIKPVAAKLCCI